jgi:uncharacterized membrane protein
MVNEKLNFGLIAYILGIVAVVEALVSPFAGIVLGIVGLVFSKKENSGLATKAKKLSIIALVIGVILFILSLILAYVDVYSLIGA